MTVDVNYWALLVTTLVSIILGSLWFGPLFGKAWMSALGMSPEDCKPEDQKGMWKSYLFVAVASLVMNYVLLHVLVFGNAYLDMSGAMSGVAAAFWSWLGFIATVSLNDVLFAGRPWKYWFIVNGFQLLTLVINGIIFAVWM